MVYPWVENEYKAVCPVYPYLHCLNDSISQVISPTLWNSAFCWIHGLTATDIISLHLQKLYQRNKKCFIDTIISFCSRIIFSFFKNNDTPYYKGCLLPKQLVLRVCCPFSETVLCWLVSMAALQYRCTALAFNTITTYCILEEGDGA